MRRRQTRGLRDGLRKLSRRVQTGGLKDRDKVLEQVGRLKERYPPAAKLVSIEVAQQGRPDVTWQWRRDGLRAAFACDGAYLLKSNFSGWTAEEFWESYMQLTMAEQAFRVMKSELLVRPIWHHLAGRVESHVMVCVLAYALWRTLDHLAKQAGLETLIRKPDEEKRNAGPKPR
ncbi:MAG: hypothetical protein HC933_17455, partial [Pleurocapsa sp. SU_196_0]|nr:hypothetical protein [Pleurocapsa sp. SU_196_0]